MMIATWVYVGLLGFMVGFGLGMGFVILLDRWHDKEMTRLYKSSVLEWKEQSRWTRKGGLE